MKTFFYRFLVQIYEELMIWCFLNIGTSWFSKLYINSFYFFRPIKIQKSNPFFDWWWYTKQNPKMAHILAINVSSCVDRKNRTTQKQQRLQLCQECCWFGESLAYMYKVELLVLIFLVQRFSGEFIYVINVLVFTRIIFIFRDFCFFL